MIYGFEPIAVTPPEGKVEKLKKNLPLFQFDKDVPPGEVHLFTSNRREGPSNIYGMPVYAEGGLFVAGGGDVFWGKKAAWLKRIDLTGLKPAERWSIELASHVMSTAAVQDGIVYMADCGHIIRAVDAATGKELWNHDAGGDFWSLPWHCGRWKNSHRHPSRQNSSAWLRVAKRNSLRRSQNSAALSLPPSPPPNGAYYVATQNKLFAVLAGGAAPYNALVSPGNATG